jgi:regulator of RNase E activity RraA
MSGLSEDTRRLLTQASTATLTTQLFKRGLRNTFMQAVRRLTPDAPVMVGEAYTLRMIPAREDLDHPGMFAARDYPQRRAIEECPAGAVLVIDGRGQAGAGTLGDILIARLMQRGVAGVVTDGAMRDTPQILPLAFPVYARGAAAPASFGLHHAVDLNLPIGCGEVAVYPGDVLVGDAEGWWSSPGTWPTRSRATPPRRSASRPGSSARSKPARASSASTRPTTPPANATRRADRAECR